MAELIEDRQESSTGVRACIAGVIVCASLLSLLTIFVEIKHLGLSWHETEYRSQLERIVAGCASPPELRRPLSAWLAIGVVNLFESAGVPRGGGLALIAIRLGQNLAVSLLALAVYRRLGIHLYLGLLGLSAVAWGMTQSHDSFGLALDVHTETFLYLLAAWAVLSRHTWSIVLIAALGALNRETSILIPVLLACGLMDASGENAAIAVAARRPCATFYAAIVAWFLMRCALYFFLEFAPALSESDSSAFITILVLAVQPDFWTALVGIFGIVPILALMGWRAWPPVLTVWFWIFGPVWVLLHVFLDPAGAHHAWLLPQLLVFVPAALLFIASLSETVSGEAAA